MTKSHLKKKSPTKKFKNKQRTNNFTMQNFSFSYSNKNYYYNNIKYKPSQSKDYECKKTIQIRTVPILTPILTVRLYDYRNGTEPPFPQPLH